MNGTAADTPRLTEENIFYNGFAKITHLEQSRSHFHAPYVPSTLDAELNKFVPEIPEHLLEGVYRPESYAKVHQKQMIALLMVIGQRLDTLTQKTVTRLDDACAGIGSTNEKFIKLFELIDLAHVDARKAASEQQKGTQQIFKALENLQQVLMKSIE
jgi:hypothetical protein